MFVTTLLIIVGTLLSPDAPLSCRVVATPAGYDFAHVRVGECVTLAAEDGSAAAYVVTGMRIEQVLGADDGYGEFAFDALDTEAGAFLYKLIERHALVVMPPRMRYGGV